jgi:nucleoside transporter
VVLGQYLEGLHFTRKAVGNTYATMSLGSIIAPLIVGTIADRYFAGEQVLAVLHLTGAVLLFWLAQIRQQRPFYWIALAYALVYAPTMMLVNPVTFAQLADGGRDFPSIRLFGSIGWIVANLSLKLLLKPGQPVNNRPILLAAALSVVLGIYSLFLPHTPPPENPKAFPALEAISLLKDSSFAVFFGVSFLISVALAFYFSFTAIFLEKKVGVRSDNVGPLMTIGQWTELALLLVLPWFLDKFGMKWVLAMGMAAWGLRYGFFAMGKPLVLIILGIALHGVCFDFFFAAGFIHVDKTAPADIRASGQALFAVLTYGLGMYLGTEASGWLNQYLTREVVDPKTGSVERVTDWRTFWLIPAVSILASVLIFLMAF